MAAVASLSFATDSPVPKITVTTTMGLLWTILVDVAVVVVVFVLRVDVLEIAAHPFSWHNNMPPYDY
jgi:hypothetical protein